MMCLIVFVEAWWDIFFTGSQKVKMNDGAKSTGRETLEEKI
jgi:hypothetical protein